MQLVVDPNQKQKQNANKKKLRDEAKVNDNLQHLGKSLLVFFNTVCQLINLAASFYFTSSSSAASFISFCSSYWKLSLTATAV